MSESNVEKYSFLDPLINSDPYEFYGVLHKEQPVYKIPEVGIYMLTKYDDIRMALKDYETFSNDVSVATRGEFSSLHQDILVDGGGWEHVQTLQRTDPPVHKRYRKLVDRVFTKKRVDELLPHLDEVVNELIDNFIEKGNCDFNDEFAMRMPGIIIAEQLGLSRDNVATFKKWADSMLGASRAPIATKEEVTANANIELEAQLFLADVFEDRRKNPKEDLMSAMVHAHGDDEEPLSMHELQNLMHQLITGGYETTQSAINHGMWALIRFPEIADKINEDDSLLKPFTEEVLRWESPVQFLLRRTQKGSTFGSDQIFQIDQQRLEVSLNGNVLDLTTKEFELMDLFIKNPGMIFSRDEIIKEIKGIDAHLFSRSIDILISRLRHKIEDDPKEPKLIKTIWGKGYMFVDTR